MCVVTASAVAGVIGGITTATTIGSTGLTVAGTIAGIANVALAASAIAGVAGSVMSAQAAKQQGEAQQAMYNYQAKINQENSKIAKTQAAMERQQGIEESRLQRMKVLQTIGSQQTAMAANGVDITQGTALDVIEDTAAMGELDALQTRYNYERKAINYEIEANNFSNQANLDIIAGQNAYKAGNMNALATGLSGLSRTGEVASKWFM